jgi:hypothetical protein
MHRQQDRDPVTDASDGSYAVAAVLISYDVRRADRRETRVAMVGSAKDQRRREAERLLGRKCGHDNGARPARCFRLTSSRLPTNSIFGEGA